MVSVKMIVSSICFVSFVALFGNISARPADLPSGDASDLKKLIKSGGGGGDGGDGGKHIHTHKIGGGGKHVHKIGGDGGDGETHVHKIGGDGGDGETHVHKIGGGDGDDGGEHVHKISGDGGNHVHKISGGGGGGDGDGDLHVHKTGGEPHVHHYKTGGGGGDTDINIHEDGPSGKDETGDGGAKDTIEVPKIFQGLDPALIAKLKTHQYGHFGVDSTKPKDCEDEYYFNDGVLKHFVRGTRDAGDALFSGLNDIIQGILPEIGPVDGVLDGTKLGLQDLLCGAENAFSDFADDFDSATHIAKHGLIDAFKFEGPGILGIPEGIIGIGGEAVKAAGSAVEDAVSGIGNGIAHLVGAI